jgi:hypothetical protein
VVGSKSGHLHGSNIGFTARSRPSLRQLNCHMTASALRHRAPHPSAWPISSSSSASPTPFVTTPARPQVHAHFLQSAVCCCLFLSPGFCRSVGLASCWLKRLKRLKISTFYIRLACSHLPLHLPLTSNFTPHHLSPPCNHQKYHPDYFLCPRGLDVLGR